MHEYEVRIFQVGSPVIISAEIQLNDNAAIRSARKHAKGRKFEVWRGLTCIFVDNLIPRNETAQDQTAA